ncbi:MAG: LuxR family transcriptional regulator, partial [Chloroflexi bacterium]|nr:LuxR family transcriptional regulator [Chloroflexota bacterium]
AGLHVRASEWYESHGWMLEAFRHAAAAHDVERAERLIENKAMGLHLRSVATTILDWLEALPAAVLDARPRLRVRSATLALMAWRIHGVEEKLLAAEAALQNCAADANTRDLTGQIACARATLALIRYDLKTMLTQAHRALAYLPVENHTFLFTANWALATANLLLGDRVTAARACQQAIDFSQKSGSVFSKILATTISGTLQHMDNQLHQAAETYRRVLELSGENPHPNAGNVQLGLAEIYYQWNDLESAAWHAQHSLHVMQQYDQLIDRFILCEVFLARLQLARGDTAGAAARLAGAERSARQQNFRLRLPDIAAGQVWVLIRQRRPEAAAALARQYDLPLSLAQALIAQGDPAAARAVLDPVHWQMEARGWADELLKTMVLQAVGLSLCGVEDQAEQVLDEALALAEPGGFVRLFVDMGAPMQALLARAAGRGIRPAYVHQLLAAFEAETREEGLTASVPDPSRPVDALTPRELEVLRLIAQGLSNQEIGQRLFLALDTVKGHNRRIFEKLQVQRRTEAIARARA